jgi:hypothetical protein
MKLQFYLKNRFFLYFVFFLSPQFSSANSIYKTPKYYNRIALEKSIDDSLKCTKTFTFELEGNINQKTASEVVNYIKNKTGICEVDFNVETKIISLNVVESMDIESIKTLIRRAHHNYLLIEK